MERSSENISLELEIQRLNELVLAFTMLNSTLELGEVLNRTLETAQKLLRAEMGSIALFTEDRASLYFAETTDPERERLKTLILSPGSGIIGYVASSGKGVRIEDASKDPRFNSNVDHQMNHQTTSYLCVPLIVKNEIIGTAQVMNRIDGSSFTKEDEDLLSGFAGQAALAIRNAKAHTILLRQKAMDAEMKVCQEIQKAIYPERMPEVSGWSILGESIPCDAVGGDYFNFLKHNSKFIDIYLADVSGKGIAAALLVSEIHTGINILSLQSASVHEAILKLNNHLREFIIEGKFVTMFGARLILETGVLSYIVAGHPPPWIITNSGELLELEQSGPILGAMEANYTVHNRTIEKGEILVAFTDAYSEAMNSTGELFGERRIALSVSENRNLTLEEILLKIKTNVSSFSEGKPFRDDATMILLRRDS